MARRRELLGDIGLSLCLFGSSAGIGSIITEFGSDIVSDARIDTRRVDVDTDADREWLVGASVVPAHPFVVARLEVDVGETGGAVTRRETDGEDGWRTVARFSQASYEHRGTRQHLTNDRLRVVGVPADATGEGGEDAVADVEPVWLAKSVGFQPGESVETDYGGFVRGDVLRLVVVPYDREPRVVAERVVGYG